MDSVWAGVGNGQAAITSVKKGLKKSQDTPLFPRALAQTFLQRFGCWFWAPLCLPANTSGTMTVQGLRHLGHWDNLSTNGWKHLWVFYFADWIWKAFKKLMQPFNRFLSPYVLKFSPYGEIIRVCSKISRRGVPNFGRSWYIMILLYLEKKNKLCFNRVMW